MLTVLPVQTDQELGLERCASGRGDQKQGRRTKIRKTSVRFKCAVWITSMEVARRCEDEERSYGCRYGDLLFWRDELRRCCRKRLRGCVEGEGHGRASV